MSERHDPVAAAFDALRTDAGGLDTAEPLRAVTSHRRMPFPGRVILGGTVVAVIAVLGFVFLRGHGGDDVVAGPPDTAADQTGDGAVDSGDLDGSSWTLVEGRGPTGEVQIVEGWPITLVFDAESLGGRAACNGYGAEYRTDEREITIGELSGTEMACGEPVMETEAAFLAAVRDVETIAFSGNDLILSGPSTELRFALNAPVPVAELIGQVWLLDSLIRGDVASSVRGDPATLLLDDDGTLEGGTGCRSLSGEYVVSGDQVLFTSFAADGDCPSQLRDQDDLVVSVLGDGFTAEIDGGRLTLMSVGNEGLGYHAVTDDEVTGRSGESVPAGFDVSRLLDEQPIGTVAVVGDAIPVGGGWILCDRADPEGFAGCGGRWVTVTNFVAGEDDIGEGSWEGSLTGDGRFAIADRDPGITATEAEQAVADAYANLSVHGTTVDTTGLRLADTVLLGLGDQLLVERTAAELEDLAAWELSLDAFRGRVGPFSAAELLREGGGTGVLVEPAGDGVELTVGPHDHCASPPAPISEQIIYQSQLSLQPTGIDSCLEWFAVDLFLNGGAEVVAITLELYEP